LDGIAMTGKSKLIITGMHRSGTSMTTGILDKLGYTAVKHGMMINPGPDNKKGFFELINVATRNEIILRELFGKGCFDITAADRPEVKNLSDHFDFQKKLIVGVDAIKDPRISLLIPEWNSIAPGSKWIFVHRDRDAVVRSLRNLKQTEMDKYSDDDLYNLVDLYRDNIERNKCLVEHVEIQYEDILEDWRAVFSGIEIDLNIKFNWNDQCNIDLFIDKKLNRSPEL
jgi:hypothetical protein